jgi:hypothetical protein
MTAPGKGGVVEWIARHTRMIGRPCSVRCNLDSIGLSNEGGENRQVMPAGLDPTAAPAGPRYPA